MYVIKVHKQFNYSILGGLSGRGVDYLGDLSPWWIPLTTIFSQMMIHLSRIQIQLNTISKAESSQVNFDNNQKEKNLINHIWIIIHSIIVFYLPSSFIQFPGASECFSYDGYGVKGTADEVWVMDMINRSCKIENDGFNDKDVIHYGEKLRKDSLLFLHVLINKKILVTTIINDDAVITVRRAAFSREGSDFRINLLQNLTRRIGVWRAICLMSSNSVYLSDQDDRDTTSSVIGDSNNSNGRYNEGDRCDIMTMRKDEWDLIEEQQQLQYLKQQSLYCSSSQPSDLYSDRIEVSNSFQIFGLNYVANESKDILSLLNDCDELYSLGVINTANFNHQIKKWEMFGVQKDSENLKNDENRKNLGGAKNLVWYNDVTMSLGGLHDVNTGRKDGGNNIGINNYDDTNKGYNVNSTQSPNLTNDVNIKSVEKNIIINLKNHWSQWLQKLKFLKENQLNLEREKESDFFLSGLKFEAASTEIDGVHDALISIIAVISSCLCDYDCMECGWRTGVSGVGYTNDFKLKGIYI